MNAPARPESKWRLAADAAKLWGGTVVEQLFALARGVVLPRWLGPTSYGVFGGLGLILKYGAYLQLGLTNAAGREIPYALAADERARADAIARAVYGFSFFASVIPAAALALYAVATWGHYRPEVSWGLVTFAVLLVTGRFELLFDALFQARRQFGSSFAFTAVKAAVSFALVVGLLYFYRLYGVYVGLVASGVIFWLVGTAWTRSWAAPWPDWRVIRTLLKIGLPFVGIGALGFFLQSFDRLLVIKFLPGKTLGYYMLATTVVSFIYIIPLNVGQAMAPRIFALPREGDHAAFEEYVARPTLVITFLVAAVGGLAILALIPFVRYVLPAYEPAVPVVAALLVGVTCQGGVQGAGFTLIALGRFGVIALAQLVALVIGGAVVGAALLRGWGLVGVGLGSSAALVVYSFLLQALAVRAMSLGRRKWVAAYAYLLLPPAAVAAALTVAFEVGGFLAKPWFREAPQPAGDLATFGVRVVLFAVPLALCGLYVERQTGIARRAWTAARERLSRHGR